MIQIEEMEIEGIACLGITIGLGSAPLVIIKAPKGYVMCGYLDMATAEKMADTACLVRGVSSPKEMLEREVMDATSKATQMGIQRGMKVKEAISRLK
jgi:uncharacterized protein YunC (DUF1805 family)